MFQVISGGLDGKLIVWDTKTFEKVQDSDFVACIVDSILIVYWINLNVSVRYSVPNNERHSEQKNYTCVAAHPNDCIVATGNGLGEIFIWWNLCAQTDDHLNMLNPVSDEWTGNENCAENDTFDDVKKAIKKHFAEGRLFTYYPVHPSHVKRSLLHWHSVQVTSLCFTSCGTHLLSGGLEGVLVKWDVTDCFGGPQQRRFLPHFGYPVSSVRSHGGLCEDMISVNLENNSFHIMDGAFTIIYSKQGFMQLPKHWFPVTLTMPENLMTLQSKLPHRDDELSSTYLLTNGGCGKIQLMNVNDREHCVQTIDITHQNLVVRSTDSKHPIIHAEVLLMTQLCTEVAFTWFVTYECVKKLADHEQGLPIDDQSRLTWWQCRESEKENENKDLSSSSVDGIHDFVKFTSVDTYSMSHFGCPAVSMEFVPSEKNQLYVLLMDYRLMIWNYNIEYTKDPIYSPWIPASCHLLSYCNQNSSILPPGSLIIPFNVQSNVNQFSTSTSFLVYSGLNLTLLNWNQILLESNPKVAASICLRDNLLNLWPDSKKNNIDKCVIVSYTDNDDDNVTRYLAITIRGHAPRSVSERTSIGGLCLLKCTPSSVEMMSVVPDVLATCLTSHPSKPWLAVGLKDGTVTIYEVQLNSNIKLNIIHHWEILFLNHYAIEHMETTGLNISPKQRSLLQLVDTAAPVKFDNHIRANKRKLNSDIQLENTLKQISEYPIYTAPPPDQLLHQLMRKQ
ncbi:unnamed protein product [Schistosoma mattheei]|uniref:WD_REPEATS_REGION domain-containing protein n=1 Tax=Schistosoma mattheei TaxID=31246 RepID=A0AA85ATJ1_9TREM|nr:unnamed protein product [Schistosoma mattheei]